MAYKETDEIPKHHKKAPKKKPYGIEYFRSGWIGGWTSHDWYATSKARDNAYDDLLRKTDSMPSTTLCSKIRKVER